jgi:hypothetical protein
MAAAMKSQFWLLDVPHNQRMLVRAAQPEYRRTPCSTSRHAARLTRVGDLHLLADPSAIRDFTWSWMSDLLVSPRVLAAFERHHITGFEVRPVVTEYRKPVKAPPTELHEIVVTGWAGLPSQKAGLSVTAYCPECGRREYSVEDPSRLIDPSTWDGSDLFMVWPLPRFRFASDRLADLIRQEKFSGVKLIPAAAIEIDKRIGLGPGSLFQWMPEKRAVELGQRFNIS